MAASRLALALSGLLIVGTITTEWNSAAVAQVVESDDAPVIPDRLELKADRQFHDRKRRVTIVEGNVTLKLGAAELQADRIEFDATFQTLFARGSVRFRRGRQYFQASALRFNLVQNEGELDDVYGVIDLETLNSDAQLGLTSSDEIPAQSGEPETAGGTGMACPPMLPPVPDWHPHSWAVTAWGGQMIDAAYGDTFLGKGRMRPEAVLGVGLQRRILRAGPLALELEADLFSHIAGRQPGGEFNQDKPYADLPAQSFGEGVVGIGARLWVQPWLSFSFMEGISYNTDLSLYEKTYREKYSQVLNYLGVEVEAAVSPDVSVVGRIHHRSGVYGLYNRVTEGSNAYLLGLRYRWGRDQDAPTGSVMPPPLGCPDPDRATRVRSTTLSERLESVALGDGGDPQSHVPAPEDQASPTISPAEQQALRTAAVKSIDQRVSDVRFKGSFSIERRSGVPTFRINSTVKEENRFGVVRVPQLQRLGSTQLLNGTISRWRIQAAKVRINAKGWQADRMGFTNDPFTPAQTRIDAQGVIAREQANGDVLISARRNRLILEERLPIPVSRRQLIQKEEEVENRWVLGIDNKDRDGLFVGRNLRPIKIGSSTELALQPQLLVQKALDGKGDDAADLFGLEADLRGQYGPYRLSADADISSFNSENVFDRSRYWGSFGRDIALGGLGTVRTNLFGAYRYRTWNGSLGETNIRAAYGLYGSKRGEWSQGDIRHRYLVRAAVGDYYADRYNSDRMLRSGRGSIFGSLTSSIALWRGETAELSPSGAYRFSPVPIVPGLSLDANLNTTLAIYNEGRHQESLSLSGGPTLTLGTFSRPFLDYTQLSVIAGGTLRNGASPYDFDRIVDFGTLGVGVNQQLVGPLVLSTGVNLNVDPGSQYYGDVVNSNIELRWQRRSYDVGIYFNPYEGIGGVRFRLNDFDFKGTGVPFMPYTPADWLNAVDRDDPQ